MSQDRAAAEPKYTRCGQCSRCRPNTGSPAEAPGDCWADYLEVVTTTKSQPGRTAS